MAEYISTFITGFDGVIERAIKRCVRGRIDVKRVYDGLVHYAFDGNPSELRAAACFNNTFLVINTFTGRKLSFRAMAAADSPRLSDAALSGSTFRVRYSEMNRFVSVPRDLSAAVESKIRARTRMRIDRLNPDTEFWYIIRAEGVGYFARLLHKRAATEKTLNKGELRPEFAYLLCCLANPAPSDTVCDPFAGHGALPAQIAKHFKYKYLYINDNGASEFAYLKDKFAQTAAARVLNADARHISDIGDGEVNAIITDPPWGIFEQIEDITNFYTAALIEMERMLSVSGVIVLVTAKKAELETAVGRTRLVIERRIDTLVNGKKAGVFVLRRNARQIRE